MKRSLPLLAAVALLVPASAQAGVTAGTQTTSAGAVSATLSWLAGHGPVNTSLTITRNGGYVTLARHHGKLQIVGEDTRFDDVQPGFETPPARVFEYAAPARLIDVSRTDGRAEVRDDLRERASEIHAIVSGQTPRLRGEVIAYVADQYMLGRGAFAIKRLDRLIAQGRLGTPKPAAAFRKRLVRALRRNGYLS